MCIQIYRRCICGHREKNGPPQRCEKAHKASRIQYFVSFAGPKIGRDGYCTKKKDDSFGVPEPCQQCKAEGGIVTRIGGSNPIERPDANLSGQAYYYGGGLASRAGGAQGLAPLPPPKAHLYSPYSNETYRRAPPSRYDTQPQQPQVYQDQARRSSRYENPRTPPPPPSRSTKYAPEPDSKVRKQSEQHAKKTLREAEKVSKDRKKKKGASGHGDPVDDIRARAIAKAREQKRLPEPPTPRHGGGGGGSSSRHRRAVAPAGAHEAAYPDIRHHPAMKSDVQLAVHHEAFTTGTHYDEATRRFQDSMVRRGAASHPNTHSHGSREPPNRNLKRYATTRTEHDRYQQQQQQQQQPYVAPYGGYGLGAFGVSPLNYSPPETEISAFNVTQKLPYTYK